MASDPKSSPAKFRYGGVFNDDLSRGISLFVYLASLPLSSPVVSLTATFCNSNQRCASLIKEFEESFIRRVVHHIGS
jgi:hypothetical protein